MTQVAVLDLLQPIRQLCRGAPRATLVDAYVRAARRFCNQSRWLLSTINGSTTAPVAGVGTYIYTLGTDANHEICGIAAIEIQGTSDRRWPLTSKGSSSWNKNHDFQTPESYQFVPGNLFAVYPTPDQAYPLTVTLVLQPKRGVVGIDDSLLVNWEDDLINGALGYLFKIKGMPWYDLGESTIHNSLFESAIHRAKSDVGASFNAGALPASNHIGPRAASQRTRKLVI